MNTIIHERIQAQLKFFSRSKMFGFCRRPNKQGDVFISLQELEKSGINVNNLRENDLLEFDLVPVAGKGGKAKNIKLISKAKADDH